MGFRVGGSIFQVPPAEIGLILSKLELFLKKTVVKDQKKNKNICSYRNPVSKFNEFEPPTKSAKNRIN